MKQTKIGVLDEILKEIDEDWRLNVTELFNAFEEVHFKKDELLSNNWGELYFIAEGIFGKYEKSCPMRYAIAGESIMIPNYRHKYIFKALTDSKVYMIPREVLYHLNKRNPYIFPLYDKIMARQERYLDFKTKLKDLPNCERLPVVLAKFPKIRQYITNKELACFLGYSRETLRKYDDWIV